MNFAIIVIGYNRPDSLSRLLVSLNNSVIDDEIPLIISLDYFPDKRCEKVSNEFVWKYGKKEVVTHDKTLGLKRHILECGSYTEEFENVLLLEDDLYVSPYFLTFAKEAIKKYNDDERIAGIGLYNYSINKSSPYRFEPINDGFDAYFMQFACSWGQIWYKKKWLEFYEWYQANNEPFDYVKGVPQCVSDWDEKSWLKYYVRYCVEKNLYFVYPKISLVTNFSDVGTHVSESSNAFQMPLLMGARKWNMPSFEQAKYLYDAFFENEMLYKSLGIPKEELLVDLYGIRSQDVFDYSYWLTTTPANFKVIKKYGLLMKPRDLNIILDIPGGDIFLYDLRENTSKAPKNFKYKEMAYHIGCINTKELVRYSIYNAFVRLIKKIKKYLSIRL